MKAPEPQDEGRTLTQRAYGVLRQDILSGVLEPGARLRIEALRKRYDIGPTPLREALSRLASDGFVVSEENRGFRIPGISLEDLRDVTNQRRLIECAALREAIGRADEDFEANVLAAYYRLSKIDDRMLAHDIDCVPEWESRHREFHRALIEGADSPWLNRFQEVLYDQADRYRRLYLPKAMVPKQVMKDHKLILDATLAGDADAACELLANHIERVYQIASASPLFTKASA